MNDEKIARYAREAVEQTQVMMIMEYKNFESELYKTFARLIIDECTECVRDVLRDDPNLVMSYNACTAVQNRIKESFGVE
jgi:hypothetical protein